LTTAVIGGIINYLNCALNPTIIGRILACAASVGYGGSIFVWLKAGKRFELFKNGT